MLKPSKTVSLLSDPPLSFLKTTFVCLFVLVVAHSIFSWDMWHLVLWPGIKPGTPAMGAQCLSHWTAGRVLILLLASVTWVYLSGPRKIKQNTSILEILRLEGYLVASPLYSSKSVVFNQGETVKDAIRIPCVAFQPYTVLPINSFPEFWCAPRVWKGPTGHCEMLLHPTPREQLWTTKRNFDSGHAILNLVSERKLVIPLQHPEQADLILLHFAWLHFTSTAFLTNWRSLQCFFEQVYWQHFPNNICSLRVSVSHLVFLQYLKHFHYYCIRFF